MKAKTKWFPKGSCEYYGQAPGGKEKKSEKTNSKSLNLWYTQYITYYVGTYLENFGNYFISLNPTPENQCPTLLYGNRVMFKNSKVSTQ